MFSSFASLTRGAFALATILGCASFAQAQLAFNVQVKTSALSGSPASPLYLDFQLNDGASWGDGNNTAWITNFQFGGGAALAPTMTFGGATGNFASGVKLVDSEAFNEFFQAFTPGSWVSFTVSLTTHADAGPIPDLFTFAILDSTLNNIATNGSISDSFLDVNITGANAAISVFSSTDLKVPAPTVTPVPEPSTYGLFAAAGMLGLVIYRSRRGLRRAA